MHETCKYVKIDTHFFTIKMKKKESFAYQKPEQYFK